MVGRRQLLVGAAAGTVGLAVGAAGSRVSRAEGQTDADLGLCADVTTHHVQALAMCQRGARARHG